MAIVSELFTSLFIYMGLCEDDPSCDKTTMRLCLQVMPRHVGDIAASWALQVGTRAIPDLGAPCLIESLTLLSLEKNVLSLRIIYIGE